MLRLLKPLLMVAALFVIANFMLGFCAHTAWSKDLPKIVEPKTMTLDEEGIAQLRLFKKEIARLQYTEFCATVKIDVLLGIGNDLQGAMQEHKELEAILGPKLEAIAEIVNRYRKNGCGDA